MENAILLAKADVCRKALKKLKTSPKKYNEISKSNNHNLKIVQKRIISSTGSGIEVQSRSGKYEEKVETTAKKKSCVVSKKNFKKSSIEKKIQQEPSSENVVKSTFLTSKDRIDYDHEMKLIKMRDDLLKRKMQVLLLRQQILKRLPENKVQRKNKEDRIVRDTTKARHNLHHESLTTGLAGKLFESSKQDENVHDKYSLNFTNNEKHAQSKIDEVRLNINAAKDKLGSNSEQMNSKAIVNTRDKSRKFIKLDPEVKEKVSQFKKLNKTHPHIMVNENVLNSACDMIFNEALKDTAQELFEAMDNLITITLNTETRHIN